MILTKLLLTALGKVARGILFGLVSERLTVKLVFWLVKQVTDRTDNRWDDQVLVFLKEAYSEGTSGAGAALNERMEGTEKAVEVVRDDGTGPARPSEAIEVPEGAMPRPQAESPAERDSVAAEAMRANSEVLK